MPLPSVFQGVQGCRLPAFTPSKPSQFSRRPFHNAPNPFQDLAKATMLAATCPCHLFLRAFKAAVCPPANRQNPPAGLSTTLQTPPRQQLSQLHAPAISTTLQAPPRQQLSQLHAPAICFLGRSMLPFARPQNHQNPPNIPAGLSKTLQTLSKATTLAATCPFPRQQLSQLHAPAIFF